MADSGLVRARCAALAGGGHCRLLRPGPLHPYGLDPHDRHWRDPRGARLPPARLEPRTAWDVKKRAPALILRRESIRRLSCSLSDALKFVPPTRTAPIRPAIQSPPSIAGLLFLAGLGGRLVWRQDRVRSREWFPIRCGGATAPIQTGGPRPVSGGKGQERAMSDNENSVVTESNKDRVRGGATCHNVRFW